MELESNLGIVWERATGWSAKYYRNGKWESTIEKMGKRILWESATKKNGVWERRQSWNGRYREGWSAETAVMKRPYRKLKPSSVSELLESRCQNFKERLS